MKKILFLFIMFAGLLSSLYASPPIIENTLNLNAGQENVNTKNGDRLKVVAAHADKKVIISHKDTLIQHGISGGYKLENTITENETGDFKEAAKTNAALIATKAVVCYPLGEGGV